jgi:hypothetical protein
MSAKEAAEGKLDASSHKKIRQVLWALRSHDSGLALAIDDFVFSQVSHPAGSRNLIVPEKIVIEFDEEKLLEFANNIRTCILNVGSPDAEWAEQYSALEVFSNMYERWPVQRSDGDEGVLAKWVSDQRHAFKKSALSSERVKRLEELSNWSWCPRSDTWDQNFAEVQAFRNMRKRWPTHGAAGEEGVLAVWLCAQRQVFKKSALSPKRAKRLEELPNWSWDVIADKWYQNFEEVRAFHSKHKRYPAQAAAEEEAVLAKWVTSQRKMWKKSALSPERVKRLEELPGWAWDVHADKWDQNFAETQVFHGRHKRWPVQGDAGEAGALAAWVCAQRQAWKKNTLSPERVKRLEEIAGWSWDLLADAWNRNFAALQVFRDEHKRWPASAATGEEAGLARWIGTQRQAFKKSSLPPERTTRLNSISGWTWSATEQSAEWVLEVSAPNR